MRRGKAIVMTLTLAVGAARRADVATWNDVVERYEHVHDYTALYEKEERAISNGERQTIRLAFRKPLDVRLEWVNDKGKVDQIAVYRRGHNDGKVVARRSGFLGGLAGTVTLDPHDRLALQDSRHPITEVGLGHIIERVSEALRRSQIAVRGVHETVLDGRPAYQFDLEATSGASVLGVEGARRGVVWIDRELKLPVRVDVFDAKNTLLERHRFKDLRVDVGLTDKTFSVS
jgi:outer membrane lipoprotein-sorting protein